MKKCISCCKTKTLKQFPERRDSKDGHRNACKLCRLEYIRKYYKKNRSKLLNDTLRYQKTAKGKEIHRQASAKYNKTEKGRKVMRKVSKKQKKKFPHKNNARSKVHYAIKVGRLQKGVCVRQDDCKGRIEAHHPNYNKPLDIIWLCKKHHIAEHILTNGLNKPMLTK